jgi:hypothetical protein
VRERAGRCKIDRRPEGAAGPLASLVLAAGAGVKSGLDPVQHSGITLTVDT